MDNDQIASVAPMIVGVITPFLVQVLRSKALPIKGFWALLLTIIVSAAAVGLAEMTLVPNYTMHAFLAQWPQTVMVATMTYKAIEEQLNSAMPVKSTVEVAQATKELKEDELKEALRKIPTTDVEVVVSKETPKDGESIEGKDS